MATSKERLKKIKAQKKKIKERSEGGNMFFFKPDTTTRLRGLQVPEDEAPLMEIVHFYLGQDIKGVISPATFGEPCAIMEMYEELKENSDDDDKKLLESLKPKKKYVMPCIRFKDSKGKEVDSNAGVRLALLTGGQYQDVTDFFLDEDEAGDFTDPKEGYDIKFSRIGSGMQDTEYSCIHCKPTKLPKEFNKVYSIEELVRKEIPSYERTQEIINQFLGIKDDDKPRKKKSKKGSEKKTTKSKTNKKKSRS